MSESAAPYLIVGTGPSALAAAMAFQRLGVPFEVLDIGYDLEPGRTMDVHALASVEPPLWARDVANHLFQPPEASADGVEKRLAFGSDFPYRRPDCLSLTTEQCVIDVSHGRGGFGNVWGAAILPYAKHDLSDWPSPANDLAEAYRNVSAFVPSSAENDRLARVFPLHPNRTGRLERSEQTENMLRFLGSIEHNMNASGIEFGRARVAVDSDGGISACRYCGRCLDGCVYGSIFNPRPIWKKLEQEGLRIHWGLYALEFEETPEGATLTGIDVSNGALRQFKARRLFIGTGAIATTRLVARSLGLVNRAVSILDSQYFFFPLLAYRGARDTTPRVTLADVFLEVLNERVSGHYVHFQAYGLNQIFQRTLESMIPAPLRWRKLLEMVERRFYLLQGFLHSADSGRLELTIRSSTKTSDEVHIRGISYPDSLCIAKRAQSLLRQRLARFGFIPWLYLKMVPLGRSFHLGGSFPAGGDHHLFSSDMLGRPAELQHVHLVDASTFPSIPATTITYTAMANSDRIVRETYKQGYLK